MGLSACAALWAPGTALASSTQLSLLQDDRELFDEAGGDPAVAMREIRDLGVDVIRTNVNFYRVYRGMTQRRKPSGFTTSDPNETQYDWGKVDRIVTLARANGIKLLLTVTGPGPYWTSERPSRCRSPRICTFRPKAREFGAFTAAVAKRYRGRVDYYSLYNEPNLYTWITPEATRTRFGRVETAGVIYRKLWRAGYSSIARHDSARRGRVLFGEVAAISSPLPMMYAALCLDSRGRPFTGRLRALHGCRGRVSRLNVGGFAIHPYNQGAFFGPQQRTKNKAALPLAHMPRMHRLISRAARRGRIPGGRGIYITEFGYQTRPPDRDRLALSPPRQAIAINESDRLFYSDRRVKMVSQYELFDDPKHSAFNTGLRFPRSTGGARKPSYDAYRLPIVVTRRSANSVEVYGQVRPARLLPAGQLSTLAIQVSDANGPFTTVSTPRTNLRGIFRVNLSRNGASRARWRLVWQVPGIVTQPLTSRIATAGRRLRYFRD
jgi:hypothetical protein